MNLNTLTGIYKSREIILDQLKSIGYDTDVHQLHMEELQQLGFSQMLDFVAVHPTTNAKVYAIYSFKKINFSEIDIMIESKRRDDSEQHIFRESPFRPEYDTIMFICKGDPSAGVQETMSNYFIKHGIFVVWQTIERTQYNVLKHILVPRFTILADDTDMREQKEAGPSDDSGVQTVQQLLAKFKTALNNLPTESRFSMPLMSKLVRPGQVVCYHRPSPTAMVAYHWVLCE